MKIRPTSSDKCNYCASITEEYITIRNLPLFTGVPNDKPREDCLDFSIALCKHCGLIQQKCSELLDNKLKKIYLSRKAQLSTPLGTGVWGRRRLEKFLDDADIRQIPNELLEIGCGTGGLLFELFQKGYRNLSGFEPSSVAVNISKLDKDFSPQIYNEFFSSEAVKRNKLEEKYDLIISTAVLEHIRDVKDFLLAIRTALKESGIAILTVPNELFHIGIIDPGLMLHEHLNYFTPKTLELILSASGFNIFNMKVKKELMLVKFGGKSKFLSELNQDISSNTVNENEAMLRKYVENLPKVISKFECLINTHKGRKIGLYGACTTSFNLLSLSKLNEFNELFFIDSGPIKWHEKLFGIPIIPPPRAIKTLYKLNFSYTARLSRRDN